MFEVANQQNNEQEETRSSFSARTVVFKISIDGALRIVILRFIRNFKGVEWVNIDAYKDLVTVKGTMDVEELTSNLESMLGQNVEVVPP
ncbi:hypothetical protein K1719_012798 [Acacia pycnantha]|nr:hypothetical protein K1719_012798 [Acacia pycnantha]